MSQAIQNVTPVQNLPLEPAQSESAAILNVIERMATNPDIDPDRIERFIALKERMDKEEARKAFAAALAECQSEIPAIEERGQIKYGKKGPDGEETGPTYALWEDINDAIRPILKQHGFALSFRTGQTPEGKISVTGILSHRQGHYEETTMVLMHDSSGAKNAVQAMGSSISYGKRYTASALLNITSRGEDDDGKAAGAPEAITALQVKELQVLIEESGADIVKFCAFMKVPDLPSIPAARFETAKERLIAKKATQK